jgi:hypothetical protein
MLVLTDSLLVLLIGHVNLDGLPACEQGSLVDHSERVRCCLSQVQFSLNRSVTLTFKSYRTSKMLYARHCDAQLPTPAHSRIILGHEFTQYLQVGQLASSPSSIFYSFTAATMKRISSLPKVPYLFWDLVRYLQWLNTLCSDIPPPEIFGSLDTFQRRQLMSWL